MNVDAQIIHLVKKIEAYNNCWHSMRDAIEEERKLALEDTKMLDIMDKSIKELRDIKGLLQVQLLRESNGLAYLKVDTDSKWLGEDCYSVVLRQKISGRIDACHLPVRVAKKLMLDSEIEYFLRGG